MDIINVIKMNNGIIDTITSFIMIEPNLGIITKAEEKFISLCKEVGYEGNDDDSLLDDAYWCYGGYEVSIVWSHEIIT